MRGKRRGRAEGIMRREEGGDGRWGRGEGEGKGMGRGRHQGGDRGRREK